MEEMCGEVKEVTFGLRGMSSSKGIALGGIYTFPLMLTLVVTLYNTG